MIEELSTNQEGEMIKEEEELGEYAIKADKFAFEDEDQQLEFNPAQPIASFKKMMNYNKEDLVGKALDSMKGYINGKVPFTITDEAYLQLT